MSELMTPYSEGASWFNDDGAEMVNIMDVNRIWAFDCYAEEAQEYLKRINGFDQLQRQNDEKDARITRLTFALCYVINNSTIQTNHPTEVSVAEDILRELPTQSLQHIEATGVEKYMPPVMQLTTVPVACREPMDFVIGFNRCRNEIKRNVSEQLRQQSTNGSDGDE